MLPKTFRMQVIYAVVFGGGLLLIGLGKLDGGKDAAAFLSIGFAILALGAVVRPIQRRHWLQAIRSAEEERSETARRLAQGRFGGLWREWLHVTDDGADRDAVR
jgi:hypothetical protein